MSESTIHKTNPETIDSSSKGNGAPIHPRSPLPESAYPEPVEASTIPATIPRRTEFGRYRIQAVLGEGGIGVVYRAWDTQLCREVALKLLRRDSPQQKVRLLREARAQARLDHANICRIYEAGEFEGEPYIAMQCIDGVSLSQMAARLNLQQKVEIGRQVAEALHAAHREGLIHRDVKPANILVEQREDQSLRAYMTDFGLVRDLAEEQGTQTGVILGTWEYMAPEQVRGDVHAVDRRTDVYGLGALLAEQDRERSRAEGIADPQVRQLRMAKIEKAYAAEIESRLAGAESREDEIPIGALRMAQQRRYDEAAEMLGRARERLRWPMERRLFQMQWAKQLADLLRQEEGRYEEARLGYLRAMEIARQPGGSAASNPAWYEAALHPA